MRILSRFAGLLLSLALAAFVFGVWQSLDASARERVIALWSIAVDAAARWLSERLQPAP